MFTMTSTVGQCITSMKEMVIRYVLPGKTRARVFVGHWEKGMVEAFRELFKRFPDANPISFDGHEIKKKA